MFTFKERHAIMDVKICDICKKRIMSESIVCSLPFPQESYIRDTVGNRLVTVVSKKLLPLDVDLCEDCVNKIYKAIVDIGVN